MEKNTLPEIDNLSLEEKVMQWFLKQGIQRGDPESIQRDLENKEKEKLLGRFKLKELSTVITTTNTNNMSLLARRKNPPFSIQLIKIEDFVESEESLNPE